MLAGWPTLVLWLFAVALGAAMVVWQTLQRSRSIHAAALGFGTTETVIATLLGADRQARDI